MTTRDTANNFFARLAETQHRALLLNFDAIFALFGQDHDEAILKITSCLQKIVVSRNTRVIAITRGPARKLKSRLKMDPTPEIWGSYALERIQPDGRYHSTTIDLRQERALKAAQYAMTNANLGACLEQNQATLVLRWEGLSIPAAKHARNLAFRAWNPIAQSNGLLLAEFEGGMELRPQRNETANAVRSLFDDLGEDSIVVYFGDRGDAEVFHVLRTQDLAVLLSPEQRDTSANLWIKSSADLLHFFSTWLTVGH